MISLSERLSAVAAMTEAAAQELRSENSGGGLCVVDVGTDHGYLPIWLITQKVAERVIAADVREGPLARAEAHVLAAGLADRIDVRLSDGFAGIRPGEAQIAVLSGMGGRLMQKLLTASPPSALGIRQLVLQPQSEVRELWAFLGENGWTVADEQIVYEEDKFYTMMRAVRAGGAAKKRAAGFGAFLLARRDETWQLFLEREQAANEALRGQLREQGGPEERIAELDARQAEIAAALAALREGGQNEADGDH